MHGGGRSEPAAHQTEDFLTFELGRGADVSLVYQVPLGASGKHGQRGMVQEEYCVFDGGQALLLPMEFYQDGFPQDEAVVRSLRVALKAREGWTVILPFEELQDVTWADAYNLNNDAFAMGNFTQYFPAEQTGGAAVYGVAGEEGQFPQEVASGIAALRAYYAERFGIEEQPYQIILLPTEEGDVIGGAGVHSVCATFDAADRRDWELLSHRMFHAYFDHAVPTQTFHAAPNLWFYEGLATYYENASMGALPEAQREVLDIRPEWQFNSLFNRYLTIKIKDPGPFLICAHGRGGSFGIRRTDGIPALYPGATGGQAGGGPRGRAIWGEGRGAACGFGKGRGGLLACGALGGTAGGGRRRGLQPLVPVGGIAAHVGRCRPRLPRGARPGGCRRCGSDAGQLDDQPIGAIPCDLPDWETACQLEDIPAFQEASFADAETERLVEEHCPVVWKLLKQYALRAQVCGVPFEEPMLRYQLLADEDNLQKWEDWLHAQGVSAAVSNGGV